MPFLTSPLLFETKLPNYEMKEHKYLWRTTGMRMFGLNQEIIFEKEESNKREEIYKDQRQDCSQHDRAAISGYTSDDIHQRLLSKNDI